MRTHRYSNSDRDWAEYGFRLIGQASCWWCCDRKSRAASAQSFTLWQQATIEFTRRDHLVRATYISVLSSRAFRSWSGEPRIQRNDSGEVATVEYKLGLAAKVRIKQNTILEWSFVFKRRLSGLRHKHILSFEKMRTFAEPATAVNVWNNGKLLVQMIWYEKLNVESQDHLHAYENLTFSSK